MITKYFFFTILSIDKRAVQPQQRAGLARHPKYHKNLGYSYIEKKLSKEVPPFHDGLGVLLKEPGSHVEVEPTGIHMDSVRRISILIRFG